MIIKCESCGRENDIGNARRDDCFCGNCEASLADRSVEVEHNKAEIEKLKWQTKSQSN